MDDQFPTHFPGRLTFQEGVEKCGRRVTVNDEASKAGIKLTEDQRAYKPLLLIQMASWRCVLYVFPKDYRSNLAAKSFRIKFEPLIEKTKYGAEYLIRVSFGTALIASTVIVYTTIIDILTRNDMDFPGNDTVKKIIKEEDE